MSSDTPTLDLPIEGMTCAACATRLEKVLSKVPGVAEAAVNFATERASVALAPGSQMVDLAGEVAAAVHRAGFSVGQDKPPTATETAEAMRAPWELWLSIVLSLPLLAPMLVMPFGVNVELPALWQWLLATPVQFIAGARFYKGAWAALRAGGANMDVLVALGTTMATIIFTSAASLRTHHLHGAVNWPIVRHITPGIFLGTFGGAALVSSMTGQLLSIIFVVFIFYADLMIR